MQAVSDHQVYGHRGLHAFGSAWEWRCRYCERITHCPVCEPDANGQLIATRDHYIPRSKGGSSQITNLVLACFQCNHAKSDLLPEEPIGPTPVIDLAAPHPVPDDYVPRRGFAQPAAWRACRDGWYKTEKQAEAAVNALGSATGHLFSSYRCQFCSSWHVERRYFA